MPKIRLLRKVFVVQLLSLVNTSMVYAQQAEESVETLPTMTITADASAQTKDHIHTATLTSVSYEELIQSGKRDIGNVLQGQVGVASNAVNRGFPARLSIRGSSSALGMVTIDDIPLFSANHNLMTLAPFTAESFESMDIIRGPGSYRYGNTALGGVIRLTSRDSKKTNAFLRVEGGSFDTASETLGGSFVGSQGRASLTLNRDDIFTGTNISDPALGNTEKDGFHSSLALGRYTLYPTDNLELNGTLLYANAKADLDDFKINPCNRPAANKGTQVADATTALGKQAAYPCNWLSSIDGKDAFTQGDTWLAQQTATLTVSPHWISSLKLGLSQQANDRKLFSIPFQFTNRLLLANWSNQHDYRFGANDSNKLSVHWGGDIREETGVGQALFKAGETHIDKQHTTTAGFMDVDITIRQWSASAGLRVNRYNDLGTHPNYYLGLGWQVLPQLKLRGSAGVGYRPPAINQLWTPLIGNPSLQPERAVSGELGIDWQPSNKLSVALTGFYSRYRNMIAFVPDQNLVNHVNAENVRVQGLEWQWRYKPWQVLNVGSDYTYTDAYHADYDRQLTNIPAHSARFFGDWQLSQLPVSVYLEGIYTHGWQWQNSPSTTIGVDDRIRFNAQLSYKFKQNAILYVRGENLNNDRTPINPTYGTPGVAVYGGIKLSLF